MSLRDLDKKIQVLLELNMPFRWPEDPIKQHDLAKRLLAQALAEVRSTTARLGQIDDKRRANQVKAKAREALSNASTALSYMSATPPERTPEEEEKEEEEEREEGA